jgi:hypothetical protein
MTEKVWFYWLAVKTGIRASDFKFRIHSSLKKVEYQNTFTLEYSVWQV